MLALRVEATPPSLRSPLLEDSLSRLSGPSSGWDRKPGSPLTEAIQPGPKSGGPTSGLIIPGQLEAHLGLAAHL